MARLLFTVWLICWCGSALAQIHRELLSDNWTACEGSKSSGCFDAKVPGHITLDIAGNRLDPYQDFAELDLMTISLKNWTYKLHLPSLGSDKLAAQLYFSKLDTVARVFCDGMLLETSLGEDEARNGFVPHVFPLPAHCQAKSCLVEVKFTSALLEASRLKNEVFTDKFYPHTINYHVWAEPTFRNLLRKPGSDFGWDWGPAFPGPGIVGRAYLETGEPGGVLVERGLRVDQDFHANGDVTVTITVRVRRLPGIHSRKSNVCVYLRPSFAKCEWFTPGEWTHSYQFHLDSPLLWYPRGSTRFQDPPNLYDVVVTLNDAVALTKRIGLRKVELVADKGSFYVLVNDEIIDWRGFNVIPFDAFSTRVQWDRLKLSDWVIGMNINGIRVWGGGSLPAESFYNGCDELGILIWHDLPWACAVFPSTNEFLESAQIETNQIVFERAFHPSIVVWGGNNEVEASFSWFKETLGPARSSYRRDYEKLFLGVIKSAFQEAAGPRAIYIDSSPSNGLDTNGKKRWGDPNNPAYGDVHFYNYNMDCEDFNAYPRALFVSEHGVQSLPSTLTQYTSRGTLAAVLSLRQRHEFGFEQQDRQAKRMFSPALGDQLSELTYPSRALLSQIMQGRCLSTAVSAWRSFDGNHGQLLWQLNDVWPGVSWSVLEHDLEWKVSAYLVAQAFLPIRVSLRRDGFAVGVFVQTYGEFRKKRIRGSALVRPFIWDNELDFPHHLLFSFEADTSEVQIARLDGSMGWKLSGFAFADTEDQTMTYLMSAWIDPQDRFNNLFTTFTQQATTKLPAIGNGRRSCTIVVNGTDRVEPYVWLSVEQTGIGRFEENAFWLFPGEQKEVKFLCLSSSCECNQVLHRTKVMTLRWILSFGNEE